MNVKDLWALIESYAAAAAAEAAARELYEDIRPDEAAEVEAARIRLAAFIDREASSSPERK